MPQIHKIHENWSDFLSTGALKALQVWHYIAIYKITYHDMVSDKIRNMLAF